MSNRRKLKRLVGNPLMGKPPPWSIPEGAPCDVHGWPICDVPGCGKPLKLTLTCPQRR
jgi:hypothetical protein